MKKLISLLLMIALTITAFPMISYAAQPKLSIASVEATPGETFEIYINLTNNPGIVSANLKVEFGEGLTLVGATNGTAFTKLTYIPPKQISAGGTISSSCQFAWMGFDIADKDIKNGKILTLKFKVNDKAKPGSSYNINVYNEAGNVIDKNLNEISLSAKATVKVIDDTDSEYTSPMVALIKKIVSFMRKIISLLSKNL